MTTRNFYYGQVVTANEINDAFDQRQLAQEQTQIDNGVVGVQTGFSVSENGVPDMTVVVAPGTGYDSQGRRLYLGGALGVDVSVDSNNASTAVVGAANEKYISLFVAYDVALSDLRSTLDSSFVYWREDDAVEFVVVQGAEALAGTAVRPSLISGYVLLADVLLAFGTTAITNSMIDPDPSLPLAVDTRKQLVYRLLDTPPLQVIGGTATEAMQGVLAAVNDQAVLRKYVYPGQELQQPLRIRTHTNASDWRDLAAEQVYTFAGTLGPVPGGGGNLDVAFASINAGAGASGLVDLTYEGEYRLTLELDVVMESNPSDVLYTSRCLAYVGRVHNWAGAVTLQTPSVNATAGGANISAAAVVAGTTDLYFRASALAALAGQNLRYSATVRVQLILFV